MRTPKTRLGGVVFAALAAASASLCVAAPVNADTESYLQKVRGAGIQTPRGEVELKEWGWTICGLLLRDASPQDVVLHTVYNSRSEPQYGLSEQQANVIVDAAIGELCSDRDGGWEHRP